MRFLLVVAAICGLCFYAFRSCSDMKDRMEAKLSGSSPAPGGKASAVADAVAGSSTPITVPLPAGAVGGLGSGAQGTALPAPEFCEIVEFKQRNFPPQDFWSQFQSIGLRVVADEPGRIAYIYGPPEAVIRTASALRASDVIPESCTLKAWAVYVDRRVTKGWDLVAALGDVLNVPDSLRVDGGTLTLDFSANDLKAALDIIADGSAVEVMQAPYCLLLHNEPATVEAIQEVPLPSTVVSQGVSQSSVQYRKVGLQLEVSPQFFGEGRVRLKVSQSNGLIGSNVDIDGSEVPIIESQRVASAVELTIGQAVVLGGVRTTRRRNLKGLLRDKEETVEGAMYIVLATGRTAPRAVELREDGIEVAPVFDKHAMPFALPDQTGEEWIDGNLLPPPPVEPWEREEKTFLRQRGGVK